jgi:hypothetical protein
LICIQHGTDSDLGVITSIIKLPMEVLERNPCGSGLLDILSLVFPGGREENQGTRKSGLNPVQESPEYNYRALPLFKLVWCFK